MITLLALDFLLEDAVVIARCMDNVSRETWPINIDDFPKVVVADGQQVGGRLRLPNRGYFELLLSIEISPSYIALGHIFSTMTKQMYSKPQGLIRLGLYQ